MKTQKFISIIILDFKVNFLVSIYKLLQYLPLYLMGGFCCGQDINKEIVHMIILEKGINFSQNKETYNSLLTQTRKKQIKMLFSGNTPSQTYLRYEQLLIKAVPLIEKSNSNIELSTSQQKRKLIVTINQQSSLRSETNIENKNSTIIETGLIIYENGYYEGDIVKNKQNGIGTFYILSAEDIIIQGEWQSGKFIKGNLSKRYLLNQIVTIQKLFYLQLKEGVEKAVVKTDDFEYKGSILLNINTLDQMITGEGTIIFKNTNAVYIGKIKNGLFQTKNNQGEKSTFSIHKQPLKQVKFQGSYQNGLRQGEGISSFNYQGLSYKLALQYLNGKPKNEGEIKQYNKWTITRSSEIASNLSHY